MNCTATTRLTAEEFLARLDALRPMPRGKRLISAGDTICPSHRSANLWGRIIAHHPAIGSCWVRGDEYVERLAAPVRRLREERRALRERVSKLEREIASMEASWVPPPYGEHQ